MSRNLKSLVGTILTMTTLVVASQPLSAQHAEFELTTIGQFDVPWALEFLPDERLLISEGAGAIKLLSMDGNISDISGVPEVDFGGQGGLGDIVLHPDFENNNLILHKLCRKRCGRYQRGCRRACTAAPDRKWRRAQRPECYLASST